MVQQEQDNVLEDTERVVGRQALRNNVAAAVALADAVRSTLGPKGLDKLLVGTDGSTLVTNDGVTVLETAKVEHPTAKMLISTSRSQDDEVRDGTTSTVILTAELLVNALELVDRGVHPTIISSGYRMSGPVIDKALSDIARVADDASSLSSVKTSLSGKGDAGMQEILAELAYTAAKITASGNPEHVRVITQRSGSIKDSELVSGIVMTKARLHREMQMKDKPGRILILDGGMEHRKPELEASLKITNLGAIEEFHSRARAELQSQIDILKHANIDCLVARDGIEEEAHSMLSAAGILSYRRIERPEIEHICRATGARPVYNFDSIQEEDVGRFESIREEKWQGIEHTIFEGSQNQAVTVVLRGSTEMRLEEAERAFDDALGVACQLVCEPQLLPGGGATQIALARRLRRYAETIPGREQMAIEGFASALESIPRILAENAGLNPIDELLRITASQSEMDSDWQGLDVSTGLASDMSVAGITEPLNVTRHAIAGATEAAISVLRIDDVLWAKQDAQEPDWREDED
ncbi:MAG: thermosome subunit alpha [Candidatus Thermoplasmatota archaeon]|nr:thermosome subunit alpha [Candidatus Thermoplasmatota archaeon]